MTLYLSSIWTIAVILQAVRLGYAIADYRRRWKAVGLP
jgi:hypothetical protein